MKRCLGPCAAVLLGCAPGAIDLTIVGPNGEAPQIPTELDRLVVSANRDDGTSLLHEAYDDELTGKLALTLWIQEGPTTGKRVQIMAEGYLAETLIYTASAAVDVAPQTVTEVTLVLQPP